MRNLVIVLAIFFLNSCRTTHDGITSKSSSISSLKFLGEYDIPNGRIFKGTTVGGLSGIDYDAKRDLFYLVSDDRSAINPARFYTMRLHLTDDRIDSMEVVDVTTMTDKNGMPYPNSKQDPQHTPDPEDIRFNPVSDEITWSSEGERTFKDGKYILEDPSVTIIGMNGAYKDSFALPANMRMQITENGPRQNGVFEGLSYSGDLKNLFVSVEEPIYEDGPRAGINDSTAWIRIIKYDVATRNPVAQFAYKTEPVAFPANPAGAFKINGVSEILWANTDQLMVVERSFSTGRLSCTIRVFLSSLAGASDISGTNSILAQVPASPVSKKLLINMDELGRYIDNVEGLSFGPRLRNGHQTLIFVADNNFSNVELQQILLFEVIP